jgi:hypothetical protein
VPQQASMSTKVSTAGYAFGIQGTKEEAIHHLRAFPQNFLDSLWLDVHGALFRSSGSELVYLFDELRPTLEASLRYMADSDARGCRLVCGLTRGTLDIPGQGSKSTLDALLDRRRQLLVRGSEAGKYKCHMAHNEMDRRADGMYIIQSWNKQVEKTFRFVTYDNQRDALAYLYQCPLAFMDSLWLSVHGFLFRHDATSSAELLRLFDQRRGYIKSELVSTNPTGKCSVTGYRLEIPGAPASAWDGSEEFVEAWLVRRRQLLILASPSGEYGRFMGPHEADIQPV